MAGTGDSPVQVGDRADRKRAEPGCEKIRSTGSNRLLPFVRASRRAAQAGRLCYLKAIFRKKVLEIQHLSWGQQMPLRC